MTVEMKITWDPSFPMWREIFPLSNLLRIERTEGRLWKQ